MDTPKRPLGSIRFYKDLDEPAAEQHRYWYNQTVEARLIHHYRMRHFKEQLDPSTKPSDERKVTIKSVEGWL